MHEGLWPCLEHTCTGPQLQIAEHRRECEVEALAVYDDGGGGRLCWQSEGRFEGGAGAAPAPSHESLAQLLGYVRRLCDRLEQEADPTYLTSHGHRVVGERGSRDGAGRLQGQR